MLQAPRESEYDLNFHFMGFPVRISWTFWLGAIFIGFHLVQGLDNQFGPLSPGRAALFLLWVSCVFVSILIHELGHTLAYRQFGIHSSIVLYHFGGLAIPSGSFMPSSSGQLNLKQRMWVSFAGPLAQLLSAVVVIVLIKAFGYRSSALWFLGTQFNDLLGMYEGKPMDSPGLQALVIFYLFPSVAWALLNLLPVLPLDGGRIAQSLIYLNGGTLENALWLSIITAGAVALYGFAHNDMFLGIFFLVFAAQNYQQLQQPGGWR